MLDILEEGDSLCYVMEYFPGRTLQEIFEEEGRQPVARLRSWMIQICEILTYLHTRSPAVVHADLKPANLYCLSDGRILLLDFGAAFLAGRTPGIYFGTEVFASPEQKKGGEDLDCRSDLYSLGATMYFLLTGKYWDGRERVFVYGAFRRTLEKCMRADKRRRYGSCRELRAVLLRQRRRKKRDCAAVLLLALVCMTAGRQREAEKGPAATEESPSETEEIQDQDESQEFRETNDTIQIDTYETRLLGGQISEIKSAILSAPDREEGYRKLLEQFLEDQVLEQEEELAFWTLLEETGEEFRKNGEGYYRFLFQLGIACRFYSEGESGSRYGRYWFEKIVNAEEETGIMDRERKVAEFFVKTGDLQERYVKKRGSEEKEIDFWKFWGELCLLAEEEVKKEEDRMLALRLCDEMMTQIYLYAEEFRKAGVEAEEYERLAERVLAAAEACGGEKEILEGVREKEKLIEETLRCVFEKGEGVAG